MGDAYKVITQPGGKTLYGQDEKGKRDVSLDTCEARCEAANRKAAKLGLDITYMTVADGS